MGGDAQHRGKWAQDGAKSKVKDERAAVVYKAGGEEDDDDDVAPRRRREEAVMAVEGMLCHWKQVVGLLLPGSSSTTKSTGADSHRGARLHRASRTSKSPAPTPTQHAGDTSNTLAYRGIRRCQGSSQQKERKGCHSQNQCIFFGAIWLLCPLSLAL
jgi:hypothetical protein